MSNSEEVSYSMDFEKDESGAESESSKSSVRSRSYSSVAESSRAKIDDDGGGGGTDMGGGGDNSAAGETYSGRSGGGSGGESRQDALELEAGEVGDKMVPLSARSNLSERAASVDDDTKSTSSQQFSNAIERYEAAVFRKEKPAPKKSSTDLSEISEIMRQLDDMEKTRGPLEKYLDQDQELDIISSSLSHAGAPPAALKTLEDLQDSLVSLSRSGAGKSDASEIDEIDEIIKKLESLEKAQSALENALSKSEVEAAFSSTSTVRQPISNPGTSRLVALNSLQHQISRSGPQVELVAERNPFSLPPAPVIQPIQQPAKAAKQQFDVDTADEMSTISELNSARNQNPSSEVFKAPLSQSSSRSVENTQDSPSKKFDEVPSMPRRQQSSNVSLPRSTDSSRSRIARAAQKRRNDAQNENEKAEKASLSSQVSQDERSNEELKNEIVRQDTLITAYQKEIEHLYKQLNTEKGQRETKEKEQADEINNLKSEIAGLKLTHLMPVLPSSPRFGQKGEVERLKEDLQVKSNQVVELRQEIARLKIHTKNTQAAVESGRPKTAPAIPEDKEKEYQKSIRALEKQVRTLQKLAFHKDKESLGPAPPGSADEPEHPPAQPKLIRRSGSKPELGLRNVSSTGTQTPQAGVDEYPNRRQCGVLEQRVSELENELQQADSEAREKVKEFQGKLTSLTGKYEARINELEKKLSEAEEKHSSSDALAMQDLTSKLDKAHVEISNLKHEVNRYKRENDILTKTSKTTQSTSRKDASTLSLALKAFKAELAEKEKELIRCKKEIAELKRTNTSLKRERERYLQGGNPAMTVPAFIRTKFDLGDSPKKNRAGSLSRQGTTMTMSIDDFENASLRGSSSNVKIPNYTLEYLQSTLEEERREFENILKEKNNLIEAREKEIKELEHRLDKIDIPVNRRDSLEEKNLLLEELRTRIQSQNKVIEKLKNHMSSYSGIELELRTLRQEKGHLEFRIRELSQKLVLAKTLSKPEHEILGDLMEKVENLNSRYFYREKQINVLLTRLATRSTSFDTPQIPQVDQLALYDCGSASGSLLGLDHSLSPPPFDLHLADL